MKRRQEYLLLAGAGWILGALAALAVWWLIPAAAGSPLLWHYLVWILLLLVCGSASFYLTSGAESDPRDHIGRAGGIVTPVLLVVGLAGLFSLTLMLVHAIWPGSLRSELHMILQSALAVAAGVILIFLSITWTHAVTGLRFDYSACCTPRELHDLLALHESQVRSALGGSADGLALTLKQLRETVLYSLHESTSLSRSPAYQSICAEIRNLCAALSAVSLEAGSNGAIEQLADRTRRILGETRSVSARQVRR